MIVGFPMTNTLPYQEQSALQKLAKFNRELVNNSAGHEKLWPTDNNLQFAGYILYIYSIHMSTVLERFKSWQPFQGSLRAFFQSSVRCAKYQSDLQTLVWQSDRTFILGHSFIIANSNVTAAQVLPVPAGPWITAISCVKAVWTALICKKDKILQRAIPTSMYWRAAFKAVDLQQHPYQQKYSKLCWQTNWGINCQIGQMRGSSLSTC